MVYFFSKSFKLSNKKFILPFNAFNIKSCLICLELFNILN